MLRCHQQFWKQGQIVIWTVKVGMETHISAEGDGKRSDAQQEQYLAEEVNKDVVAMECNTEHKAQEISEISSNNKDCCANHKNDGKGEVRRLALARRHSIDCHANLEKPKTSAYSGKRRRKLSCSSILVESDEMFTFSQRRKIQRICDDANEQNACKQSTNQQTENQIPSIEDEEMEWDDFDLSDESIDTDFYYSPLDSEFECEDTEPKDESEDTEEKTREEKQPKFWKDIRDSKLEALNKLLEDYDSNKEELSEEILPGCDILDDNSFKVTYCDFEERFNLQIEKARSVLQDIINEYSKIQPDTGVEILEPIVDDHDVRLEHLGFSLLELHLECDDVLQMCEITDDDIPLPAFMLECMSSFINTARDIVLAFSYDVEDIVDDLSQCEIECCE